MHGHWHSLHKNTLWWSQVFSQKSRCGYWLWDCAGDMIYPFPLSELVVCWLSGNILLFPCIWSMQEKHRSFKLISSSSPICSLSWEFFYHQHRTRWREWKREWQLEGFYASRRFWSLPSMPTGITARTPPTLVPGLGDSSWIVVCRPPSDLSSLYEAGVNIRAGNKLFIWSVPAFVNSSSKKRVNVQFCLRLRLADKVSLGRNSPEMS